MINTLLFELIQSLNLRERQQARKWLQSPIHNERPASLILFHQLEEQYFLLGLTPQRERIHQALFPESPYDDQKLRLECRYLLQTVEA